MPVLTKASVEHEFTTDVDISSQEFWRGTPAEREVSWARLRNEAPVSFHPPIEVPFEHEEKGFWAIVRAKDITSVARADDDFLSGFGLAAEAVPPELVKANLFFHGMDGAEHQKYRGLVSAAFTPKQIGRIIDQIHANATIIVDDLQGAGEVDFVTAVARRLPLLTGAMMFGVPDSEQDAFAAASEKFVGRNDSELGNPADPLKAVREAKETLYGLGSSLAAYRRRHPADDLMNDLVSAEIDGARLTDDDIGAFTFLMAVAATDTTKQTTSHTMLALTNNPGQRAWLMEDFDGRIKGAANEFVRYATPIIHHARTASRDLVFEGQEIAAGDKVVLFYSAGNRDETLFTDPMKFDLARKPNPHISFGGGGVHFCLGSRVALTQLEALYGELLGRFPNIEVTGEPEYLSSRAINGIKHLPVRVS
ncbi:MAG: Methyl-branched lipid omega-hydroxylase [Subtercola sp.]|jgi:cytochrome P450|nr:Methyl-branched lipid omega-hydroxylase [Subtercola sp.]